MLGIGMSGEGVVNDWDCSDWHLLLTLGCLMAATLW